jgi:serine phosphatase RsbU (regulator of sigma subunit)
MIRRTVNSHYDVPCLGIVDGNGASRRTFVTPGLDIRIDSRPLGRDGAGGDVHYISMCGGGHVTRLALADVAGHGASVDGFAKVLRTLMRKYINVLDPTRFAMALNRELTGNSECGSFATALLLTYFAPTSHLIICNAGHGRPLRYSAQRGSWDVLELKSAGSCPSLKSSPARYHLERLANLPLGVLDPTDYEQFAVELREGDIVVLCTDGITESRDATGHMLGERGLFALVNQLGRENQTGLGQVGLGERLLDAIDSRRGPSGATDDQTLIVIQRNRMPLPRPSLRRTAQTLAKLIGLSRI